MLQKRAINFDICIILLWRKLNRSLVLLGKGIIPDKGIRLLYSFLSLFQLSSYKSALQNSDFALNAINKLRKV